MSEQKFIPAGADTLARLHTAEAIGTLVQVMRDKGAKPSERVNAANSLLDRGHGRAVQATIAVPARQALASRLASMDDSALLAIAAAARAARGELTPGEGPNRLPNAPAPFGLNADDISDAELAQANPPPEEPLDTADFQDFPLGRKKPSNPWD